VRPCCEVMKRYAAQPPNGLAAGVGVNGWTSLLLDKHGGVCELDETMVVRCRLTVLNPRLRAPLV
jgi:hypothetical protein